MAAATASLSIDPTKGAKYQITVSERLLNGTSGKKRSHAAIQCKALQLSVWNSPYKTPVNHKPKLSQSKTTTTIAKPSVSKTYDLTIKTEDNGSKYTYTGNQTSTDACILVYDPATRKMILDKLDTQFAFNLQSTPANNDTQSLAKQYPHLDAEQSDHELNAGGVVAAPEYQEKQDTGDPNNPYDYRHFLLEANRRRTVSPEPRSNFGSSPAQRTSTVSSPTARPTRPAARPKPRPRPQQKRAASPSPREEADADNEDSDGDLIIEIEPDTKRRNRFMGAFDRDITSNGPISLRSAASSMSPAARNARRDESTDSHRNRDADVEELKLPSPRRSPPARTPQEEAEDEADLEAELEMALEESQADQEEGGVGLGINGGANGAVHDESSSESEEE